MPDKRRRRRPTEEGITPHLQVVTHDRPAPPQPKMPLPGTPPRPPAKAPPAPPPPLPPAEEFQEQIVVSKRFCPVTGGPKVALFFRMRDPQNTREYTLDVPMTEAVAQQMLVLCQEHRSRFDEEWFDNVPIVGPDGGS